MLRLSHKGVVVPVLDRQLRLLAYLGTGTSSVNGWSAKLGVVNSLGSPVTVTLMVRSTCGSCTRVRQQITPVCAGLDARLVVIDVDSSSALAIEFGDRVPVVLVEDEEVACWEIDDDELTEAVRSAAAMRPAR